MKHLENPLSKGLAAKLLEQALPEEAKFSISSVGKILTVTVREIDASEIAAARDVLEALGMIETISGREMASAGALEFTNDPRIIDEVHSEMLGPDDPADIDSVDEDLQDEGDEKDATHPNKSHIKVVDDDEEGTDADSSKKGKTSKEPFEEAALGIDGNARKLVVLKDPALLKIADKFFEGTQGESESMENYVAFLTDFDTFLRQYSQDHKYAVTNSDDDDEGEEASVKSLKYENYLTTLEQAMPAINWLAFEEAKEKSTRSVVLSIIMKAMSGSAGAQVIEAFEAGDFDKVADGFGKVVEAIMDEMPDPEGDEEDEEESDEVDSDSEPDLESNETDSEPL